MSIDTAARANISQRILSTLGQVIPQGADVVFIDYAVYPNVGDLLISQSVEHFFRINKNKIVMSLCKQNYSYFSPFNLHESTILVFQGGGNLGDLFPSHETMRHSLLEKLPKQRAVILPQTVYFQNKQNMHAAARRYAANKNLTIIARDAVSEQILSKYFSNDVKCAPDTAHLLQGLLPRRHTCRETLYFLRSDQLPYSHDELRSLNRFQNQYWCDWPEFLSKFEKSAIKCSSKLLQVPSLARGNIERRAWNIVRNYLTSKASKMFSSYSQVVTNRLHGLIFAIISDTPVDVVESGYGKTSAYVETWLSKMSSVRLVTPGAHELGMGRHLLAQRK